MATSWLRCFPKYTSPALPLPITLSKISLSNSITTSLFFTIKSFSYLSFKEDIIYVIKGDNF